MSFCVFGVATYLLDDVIISSRGDTSQIIELLSITQRSVRK